MRQPAMVSLEVVECLGRELGQALIELQQARAENAEWARRYEAVARDLQQSIDLLEEMTADDEEES